MKIAISYNFVRRYRRIKFPVSFLSASCLVTRAPASTGYILVSRDDEKIIILGRSGRNYSVASWKIGRAIVVRLVVTSSLVCLETIVNR